MSKPALPQVGHDLALPAGPPAPSPLLKADKKAKGRTRRRKGKIAGRFATLNDFVDCSLAGLSGAEAAAWLVLYRDERGGVARTAMTDIARRAGCNRRSVVRAVHRLESLGLLEVLARGGWKKGPSAYRVQGVGPRAHGDTGVAIAR